MLTLLMASRMKSSLALARVAALKVISRTSVMQYKTGAKRNLRENRRGNRRSACVGRHSPGAPVAEYVSTLS